MGWMEWLEQINRNAGDIAGNRYDATGLLSDTSSNIKDWRKQMESAQAATRSVMPEVRQQGEAELRSLLEPLAGFGGSMQVAGTKIAPFVKQGLLGLHETTTPGRIINKTKAEGGYSVNLPSGQLPTEGVSMGIYRNTDPRNVVTSKLQPGVLQQFAEKNKEQLAREDRLLGTWLNPENQQTYVDVSRLFPPGKEAVRKATKFGERSGQLAGYDISNKKVFDVGNWEDFIRGPEFQSRLHELAAEGNAYMSTHPTKQWWDMHGTVYEDIYGASRMPQVAGFTASTAPNELVRKNAAEATEYMRRLIKGEPIIQPNWRMPEDGILFQKGSMMPMETTRAPNLIKSSKGLLGELQADKVRNEAQAMMGDPSAMPLDVYWARVGEKPKAGIFTASQEGVVPPGKPYATMKDVVSADAIRNNDTPANYSAKIWAAIRERIKNTGNLFGEKYRRGGAAMGDSKGYADHITDLINEKSALLKITPEEMKRRLASGDANLMSLMLASPVVASVYSELSGQQTD